VILGFAGLEKTPKSKNQQSKNSSIYEKLKADKR
jgi:hypothetical protein